MSEILHSNLCSVKTCSPGARTYQQIPQIRNSLPLIAAFFVTLLFAASNSVAAEKHCDPWIARVESIEGNLQIRLNNSDSWRSAAVNDLLCRGDSIKVDNGRAALRLQNETILRADAGTHIVLADSESSSMLKLLEGLMYLITRTPRSFSVETKYVNAFIEGTEFLVAADTRNETGRIAVFEGSVKASNAQGEVRVASNSQVIAKANQAPQLITSIKLQNTVQWALYYPPIINSDQDTLKNTGSAARDAAYYSSRASLALYNGQVEKASKDVEQALEQSPTYADALALKSIIHIVQGELDRAQHIIGQIASPTTNSSILIARSYLQQAQFNLNAALQSANEATLNSPNNALTWARAAELEFASGNLVDAIKASKHALQLQPNNSRALTIEGFIQLKKLDFKKAAAAFEQASKHAPSDPMPQFGLGLIDIRKNRLSEGRAKLELAAALDPGQSLLRSYLGKAYFDEHRNKLASGQFELAQQLDANDPTPWFYQALQKQSENRPAEALQDLQTSIELNDNRAIYRSRQLLDADEAARGAGQARMYQDLGFDQMAIQSAAAAINTAPSEHGAHRQLSQAYENHPRYDVARSSEILQAQMLQPLTATPVRSVLAERDLLVIEGTGPNDIGFNEFNSLFNREQIHFQVSSIDGDNNTEANEALVSGMHGKFAYAISHYDYQTDGFRENADLDVEIDTAFFQAQISPEFSVQLEARERTEIRGDVSQKITENSFNTTYREGIDGENTRLAFTFTPNSSMRLLGTIDSRTINTTAQDEASTPLGTIRTLFSERATAKDSESQLIIEGKSSNIISGFEFSNVDFDQTFTTEFDFMPPFIFPPMINRTASTIDFQNIYSYWQYNLTPGFTLLVGASRTDINDIGFGDDIKQTNQKLGVKWQTSDDLSIRAASFRTLKHPIQTEQTLEPTNIFGFIQFYDDFTSTDAQNRGLGLDYKIGNNFYLGAELLERQLNTPVITSLNTDFIQSNEDISTLYLNWTHNFWSANLKLIAEDFQRTQIIGFPIANRPLTLKTERLPLEIRYSSKIGLSVALTATQVEQKATFEIEPFPMAPIEILRDQDDFTILDIELNYKFLNNRAYIAVEIKNAGDEKFRMQDTNFQDNSPKPYRFTPEKSTLIKLGLYF